MPHIDYSGLNADPAMIRRFLEENVVVPAAELNKARNPGQPEYLEFREEAFPKGRIGLNDSGPQCRYLSLIRSNATTTNEALLAYICEYSVGAINYLALGNAANFCFTAGMNGCTFGIGSKAKDGTVLVSHANATGQIKAAIQQADAKLGRNIGVNQQLGLQSEHQLDMILKTHAAQPNQTGLSVMSPGMYRIDGKTAATTVGYRTNGEWQFCFQSRRTDSNIASIIGAFAVATNNMRFG